MFDPSIAIATDNVIEFTYRKAGEVLTLNLREMTNAESDRALERLQLIELTARTDEDVMRMIRETVCSLLDSPPEIKGFTVDERPLRDRALEFFTVDAETNQPLKELYDHILLTAYQKHKEAANPQVFFDCFRETAREATITSQEHLELRFDFDDCPRVCAMERERSEANGERYLRPVRPKFCDDCPVKLREADLRENLHETLLEIHGSERFPINVLIGHYNRIATLNIGVGGVGYKPQWSQIICRLIDILRSEHRRPQRVADWQREEQSRQNKLKNIGGD